MELTRGRRRRHRPAGTLAACRREGVEAVGAGCPAGRQNLCFCDVWKVNDTYSSHYYCQLSSEKTSVSSSWQEVERRL